MAGAPHPVELSALGDWLLYFTDATHPQRFCKWRPELLPVIGKMTEALATEHLKKQKAVTAEWTTSLPVAPKNCRGDVSTPQCDLG